MKDIFKAMGVTIGNDRPLIVTRTATATSGRSITNNQPVRKGMGANASDVLNEQIRKGGAQGFDRPVKKAVPKDGLKNTHGEDWHPDLHESAKILSETKEVDPFVGDDDGPKKKSMSQEQLFIKSFEKPVKKGGFKNMSVDGALDGLINFAPDPFDPEMIANVHENSVEVIEHKVNKSALDEVFDIVKGCSMTLGPKEKRVPVMRDHAQKAEEKVEVPKKKLQKIDKLMEVEEKEHGMKFVKSYGPGGMVMDFGSRTGNPMADNATELLNQHSDPVQASNARYQAKAYSNAVKSYTEKGDAAYHGTTTPFGHIPKENAEMLDKGMDKNVEEAFGKELKQSQTVQKGVVADATQAPQLPQHRSIPNIPNFQKSQTRVGKEIVQAQSPTDAAVIEMMKGILNPEDTGGYIAETRGISVTAGEPLPAELEQYKIK